MVSEPQTLSRSEREALIKDKAGWVITVMAALLAVSALLGNANSGQVLNSTIAANDTWAFYQAKSVKQTQYEIGAAQASAHGDSALAQQFRAAARRYESEPETGEGKKELMAKARALEAERQFAKSRSPWFTYASSLFQLAIVLLTASILAVNTRLYHASLVVGGLGATVLTQAIWLWLPW